MFCEEIQFYLSLLNIIYCSFVCFVFTLSPCFPLCYMLHNICGIYTFQLACLHCVKQFSLETKCLHIYICKIAAIPCSVPTPTALTLVKETVADHSFSIFLIGEDMNRWNLLKVYLQWHCRFDISTLSNQSYCVGCLILIWTYIKRVRCTSSISSHSFFLFSDISYILFSLNFTKYYNSVNLNS